MRIAGLLPLKVDEEKSRIEGCLADLHQVCDDIFILHDNCPTDWYQFPPNARADKIREDIALRQYDGKWNDFCNRLSLLAHACSTGCTWGIQLDDDERLGPSLTRERVIELCQKCEAEGYVQVVVKVRTMWDETHWRTDGIFGHQDKSFIIKNPFFQQNPAFEFSPGHSLHHFPTLAGPKLFVEDYIMHFGMCTPSLRKKNTEKYQRMDPERKFSCIDYDYLLKEEGITLKSIHE